MTDPVLPTNPTIDLLLRRKSMRAYTDQLISPEIKAQLLQATMRAPTAGNLMLYTIIEIEDPAIKARLVVTCDDQPFIATAPLVLLFLADYQRWEDCFTPCGVERRRRRASNRRHPWRAIYSWLAAMPWSQRRPPSSRRSPSA